MKITPKPGDYVRTERITYAQYHAIATIFMSSGAFQGEYDVENDPHEFNLFGWDVRDNELYHVDSSHESNKIFSGKNLSIFDLIGEAEWSGKCLPPIGSVCEYKFGPENNSWVKVAIIFHDEGYAIMRCPETVGRHHSDNYIERFRPLKSEREIAIEEMVKVVSHYPHDSQAVTQICGQLYDKGYRKTKDAEK